MNRPLSYLACPYSDPDSRVRERRFRVANAAAGWLMRKGMLVFSPISHSHPIAVTCDLPLDFNYWERFDRAYLECSHELYVLAIDGWRESKGVAAELAIAGGMELPIRVVAVLDEFRSAPSSFAILDPRSAAVVLA